MIIQNLLHILQADNYQPGRFIKYAYTHPKWWRFQERSKLEWTKKTILLFSITFAIDAFFIVSLFLALSSKLLLFVVIFLILIQPIIICISLWLIYPIDIFLKRSLVIKAARIFEEKKGDLAVIGITGSYGKTSTREILSAILAKKLKVLNIGENINTDIGIAEYIIRHPDVFSNYDVFIVEMGAYQIGDIKNVCRIVKPDHGILTGINESHLEQFGCIENTISAKFELAEYVSGITVLNVDDLNVNENHTRFEIRNKVLISAKTATFRPIDDFGGIEFTHDNKILRTKLLAEHNVNLVLLCLPIAEQFGLTWNEISEGVRDIPYISHRLQPIYNKASNIWVIDDSYNGNMDGFISGLRVLQRAKGRKIVLTPGLVEQGSKEKENHIKIGKLYASDYPADLVLLINSRVSEYIISGMEAHGFKNYKLYRSTAEAHSDLPRILKSGDTIIFQNDWPDNYF